MRLTTLAALALLSPTALSQDPVISEFLASNDNGIVDFEGDSSDWIEIHNPGSSVIDLGGWHLTDDPAARTKWTFPGTTFIAPGGFLIVFASSKDLTNPADELHTNFRLTSAGEFLGLYDPTASFASTSFDRAYPEQFEDVSYGFEFSPNITSNEYYFFTPTPGSENISPGPLLTEVSHFPELPSDNDDVVVTARLAGSLGATGFVQLDYRVMYNGALSLQMLDDGVAPDAVAGDSIFTGAIPASASAPGEMLRWSITALDANWNGTREPPFIDPERDPEYFGTIVEDSSIATSLRTYHWYVQNTAAANSTAGTRASLWFEGRFYDNIRCNARGGSSQTYPKKSYKFDFNPGERFFLEESGRKVDEFNLNTTWGDKSFIRQELCYELYAACGAKGGLSHMARLHQNGEFFSVCAFIEEPDEDYLARLDLDQDGALYKMYNAATSGSSSVEKITRVDEDTSDLESFIDGIQLTNSNRRRNVFDTVDIPAVISYLAATAIMFDNDHVAKNYYLYRDTDGDGEWRFLPWDKDLTLGRNYTVGGGVLNDSMFAVQDPLCHPLFGDRFRPKNDGPWNRLIDAMYSEPDIVEMYGRRLRTLMDQLLQPPGTPVSERVLESYLDQKVAQLSGDIALDVARWGIPSWGTSYNFTDSIARIKSQYLTPRRTHFYVTHNVSNGGIIPDAAIPARVKIRYIEGSPASGIQDEEFIVLHNPNPFAVDLSGWTLSGGIEFTFDPGTVIVSDGTLYVSPNLATFRARPTGPSGGQELFVVGPYDMHVGIGEEVILSNPTGRVVHRRSFGPFSSGN